MRCIIFELKYQSKCQRYVDVDVDEWMEMIVLFLMYACEGKMYTSNWSTICILSKSLFKTDKKVFIIFTRRPDCICFYFAFGAHFHCFMVSIHCTLVYVRIEYLLCFFFCSRATDFVQTSFCFVLRSLRGFG